MTKPARSQKPFSTYNLTFCYALSLPPAVPLSWKVILSERRPQPLPCPSRPALWPLTQAPK